MTAKLAVANERKPSYKALGSSRQAAIVKDITLKHQAVGHSKLDNSNIFFSLIFNSQIQFLSPFIQPLETYHTSFDTVPK